MPPLQTLIRRPGVSLLLLSSLALPVLAEEAHDEADTPTGTHFRVNRFANWLFLSFLEDETQGEIHVIGTRLPGERIGPYTLRELIGDEAFWAALKSSLARAA